MRLIPILALLMALAAMPATAQERVVVAASAPVAQSVTIYSRGGTSVRRRGGPGVRQRLVSNGFGVISETRTVTLPQGRSTIRFEGVSEGMIAVSAIVTGLPGGTIEKNRNADLLSPASLVDGTLGNRVTITRTNPATGEEKSEDAIVRTRADGGLVLQTGTGFEAVRCSGLPEKLSFDRVPDGLSAEPIYSIDTFSPAGGTYTITLSYLSWGFDWEANYVAKVDDGGEQDALTYDLRSWLTVLNDNGQSFEDADLLVVAGKLNIVSNLRALASPPRGKPLRLTCYPIGSTARGSPVRALMPPPPPPPAPIVVSGFRASLSDAISPKDIGKSTDQNVAEALQRVAGVAIGEDLGDLKLYRVPRKVTVAAKSMKQVVFLDKQGAKGKLYYQFGCSQQNGGAGWQALPWLLESENVAREGLGEALPGGQMSVFERGPDGELLVAQASLRDYAKGEDVEVWLGQSAQAFGQCRRLGDPERWVNDAALMEAEFTNANPHDVTVRLLLGYPAQLRVRGLRTTLHKGQLMAEVTVPANAARVVKWQTRAVAAD